MESFVYIKYIHMYTCLNKCMWKLIVNIVLRNKEISSFCCVLFLKNEFA